MSHGRGQVEVKKALNLLKKLNRERVAAVAELRAPLLLPAVLNRIVTCTWCRFQGNGSKELTRHMKRAHTVNEDQ